MRYVRLTLDTAEEAIHPMQAFVMESDAIDVERLVNWNTSHPEHDHLLFHVEGDREAYEAAIEDVDSIVEYDLTPIDERSFYVYVTERPRESDEALKALIEGTSMVLIPPVEYHPDGTIRMTVGGEEGDLQALIAYAPDAFTVDVEEVGEYDRPRPGPVADLTDRQREAVAAAVDVGYYAVPREGSVANVAATLDCAESTASNHLRKAEATVMGWLVERSTSPRES